MGTGEPTGEWTGVHLTANVSEDLCTVCGHPGGSPRWYGSTQAGRPLGEAPGPGVSEVFLWALFAMATEAKHPAPGRQRAKHPARVLEYSLENADADENT